MAMTVEVQIDCSNPQCPERVYSQFPLKMHGTVAGYIIDPIPLHTYLINFNWDRIHGQWWCPSCKSKAEE